MTREAFIAGTHIEMPDASDEDREMFFNMTDTNGSGDLDWEEFYAPFEERARTAEMDANRDAHEGDHHGDDSWG